MAGNSQRRGATRKPGTKKGPVVGSGGQRRQSLEGRGPTPKAESRPGHVANRAAKPAGRQSNPPDRRGPAGRSGGSPGPRSAPRKPTTEAVAGRNSVLEALQAGIPATSLAIQQFLDSDDRVREAMNLAVARNIPLLETTRADLDRMCGGAVHQGIVLRIPPYQYADPKDLLEGSFQARTAPLIVALDGVTDPRNLGAIVRSAAAFGAHGVVIPERRAAGMTAAAWKTSAGAAARVPVAQVTNLTRWLVDAKKAGCIVLGLAAGGPIDLPHLDPEVATGPLVVVVGSEGKGLGHLVSQTCDELLAIPMEQDSESLNAGIAAAVTLYAIAMARR